MYNPAIKDGHMKFLIESNHNDDKRQDITEWVRDYIIYNKEVISEHVKKAFYDAEQELITGYIDFLDEEHFVNLWQAINHKDFVVSQFSNKELENYSIFKIAECRVIVNAVIESNLASKTLYTQENIQNINNKVFELLCETFKASREMDKVQYQALKADPNTEKAIDILAYNMNDLENAIQLAGEVATVGGVSATSV